MYQYLILLFLRLTAFFISLKLNIPIDISRTHKVAAPIHSEVLVFLSYLPVKANPKQIPADVAKIKLPKSNFLSALLRCLYSSESFKNKSLKSFLRNAVKL